MKPAAPDLFPVRQSPHADQDERERGFFPAPEFGFQPRRFGDFFGGYGRPRRRPGFSALAWEVLRADASRTFPLETAVLGFITLVAAWPVAAMIREVIRLLK